MESTSSLISLRILNVFLMSLLASLSLFLWLLVPFVELAVLFHDVSFPGMFGDL